MTANASAPHSAFQRRWLYGGNLVLLVLIALILLLFVCYLTNRFRTSFDWTTGRVNSLSPRTRALLAQLDQKQMDVELTSTFSISLSGTSQEQQDAEERVQQVRDLLDQYARSSPRIKLYRPESRENAGDELDAKIRERYRDEIKPYEELVADFDKFADDLQKFFKGEAPQFGALSQQPGLNQDQQETLAALQGLFSRIMPDAVDTTRRDVQRVTDSTLPVYSRATDRIKTMIDVISAQLGQVNNFAKTQKYMSDYYRQAEPRIRKITDEVQAYSKRLDALQPLKLDEVLSALRNNCILVFGPTQVKVIGFGDIYTDHPANDNPRATSTASFEGEQAVSSAILSMVHPEKTRIVIVNASPNAQLSTTGMFTDITQRLTKENFEVVDWSPAASPMGAPDQPPPAPPAQGKGVVWVILPPDPPTQQQMMMGAPPPDARPVAEAVRKHLDAGGSAIFLAEASSPMAALSGGPAGYPYADLVRSFGVDVSAKYTVVKSRPGEDGRITQPQIDFTRYPDHDITRPLQSLRTLFAGLPSRVGLYGPPTVVRVDPAKPADVEAAVIVNVDDPDVWASANFNGDQTTYDAQTDLKAPIPMGVAALKNKGNAEKEQRIVVLGNKLFPTDQILEYGPTTLYQGRLVTVPAFPGNGELFVNAVLWASNYGNMIALGPRTGVALRIRDISPGALAALDWGVVWLGAPALTLIIGGLVFFVRKR